MKKDCYLIYFKSAQDPEFNAALQSLGVEVKIADGEIGTEVIGALIEKNPGDLIFVCPFSGEPYLPKTVAEAFGQDLDILFLENGLPKGAEVLINGSTVYGCRMKNGENTLLLLNSLQMPAVLAQSSLKAITESLVTPALSDSGLRLLRRLRATATGDNTDFGAEGIINTAVTEENQAADNITAAEENQGDTKSGATDGISKKEQTKASAANDVYKNPAETATVQDFLAPPVPKSEAVGSFDTKDIGPAESFLSPPTPKNAQANTAIFENTESSLLKSADYAADLNHSAKGGASYEKEEATYSANKGGKGDFHSEKSYAEENGIKPHRMIDPKLLRDFTNGDSPDVSKEKPKKRAFKIIAATVAVILAATATVGGVTFYKNRDAARCDKVYRELASKVSNTQDKNDDGTYKKYDELYKINGDMVGYFTPAGAKYGYPVVTSAEKGATYYEGRLFNKEKNRYGTVYTESSAESTDDAPILVLKGNSPDSNRLLGVFERYLKQSYANKHKIFRFDTRKNSAEWVVFAAFSYEKSEPFMIERTDFLNDSLFNAYIENLKNHSKIEQAVAVEPKDQLLITVAKNGDRYTVVASRKLRSDETADKITDTVTAAADTEPSAAQSTQSRAASSKSATIGFDSSFTVSASRPQKPKTTGRYEQTGLTTDMDQTAKVQMDRVVTMVNVVGMTKAGAKSVLQSTLGVNVGIEEKESTEPRGTVLDQSVADGAEISTDVTVQLTVSIGLSSGKTVVPDLIGNLEANAETILDRSNLRKGKVTKEKSALEKGTILSQSIDDGKKINVNTKINLTVSDGTGKLTTVKMPSLTGKTKSQASAALKKAGLKVGKISTVTSSKKAGTVIKQECPSGQKVQQGEAVGFSVSNGSKVNNLTVTNGSSWSVKVNGKYYSPGAIIKGDYNDIIPCIVEAEMGSGCHIEGLKAQAVAAYCWLINAGSTKGSAPSVPMKTPESRAKKAAEAVAGQRVMYKGEVAQTYYYAISAGYSANCKDIWYADLPYLRAVSSPGDKKASGYKTTKTYSASELKSRVKSVYGINLSGVSKTKWFSVKYDENDAYVRSVSLGGKKTVRGVSFRDELLNYELRSSAFKVSYNKSRDTFTFTVYGYGHGVGMSQVGADYYASIGWSYEQILTHYYTGTTVK